jgi:tRNA threonylcarbamoyladenosine biosynthesis protein TsaE
MGTPDRVDTQPLKFVTDSPEATMELGARFAALCRAGDVVGLQGTLGAGKTCFVKGMARGLGVGDEQAVTSPSYVLMHEYQGTLTLYHFDAYRLTDASQMEEIGCQEVFDSGGVSAVEWADHVPGCLPPEHFMLTIRLVGSSRREFSLAAAGAGPTSRRAGMFDSLKRTGA